MNERIKDLKDQAFNAVWDLDKTTIGPPTHFVPDGFEEKFAELIVAECMNNLYLNGYDDAVTQIEKHFGVKE
jgi:hypothetical protein